ncbi:glycoside hydrolase family 16 protein [Phanerochaete sordida]|uniref:Glycoside hydrolase family 16 protein n=1 Tax=Phanerochaete sordida TaxID=48140 RepID=A0A9P3GCI9_9APHY|nr:glycoside hydrolase family 16 protein [Phanerochaete sordida]
MRATLTSFVVLASCLSRALGATYALTDNYVGSTFLSTWVHEAIADPTHGRVNYVDQATAVSKNLTFASGDTLILRADDTTVLSASGPGRDSVRIRSVKTYTTHVAIIDVRHMPQGCGTWPAFWETDGNDWPNGGEVDIAPNAMTLHTGANCNMPASRAETGTPTGLNCDVNTDGNTGCGVQAPTSVSYGPGLNGLGGGWYAMERTNDFIKVWFFPRNGATPSDLSSGAGSIDTDNWGTPTAFFPNTDCDIGSHFDENNIIINLTFCGDWAGAVYGNSGCPGSCVDYVNNNPLAFQNAYWDIAAVRVYE